MDLLADGTVLAAGGGGDSGLLSSAERFDPISMSWSITGSMEIERNGHSSVALNDGRLLVFGVGDRATAATMRVIEQFDVESARWQVLGEREASHGTATVLDDGRALFAGGQVSPSGRALGTATIYDPGADAWESTASMHEGRRLYTATKLLDGRVLGWADSTTSPCRLSELPISNVRFG